MSTFESDDEPAFAPTLHSILDRYRISAVDRPNAIKGLTGITLALAPEDLFGSDAEVRLNRFFEAHLDEYKRVSEDQADALRDAVVAFVWAAAQGDATVRQTLDGGQ